MRFLNCEHLSITHPVKFIACYLYPISIHHQMQEGEAYSLHG